MVRWPALPASSVGAVVGSPRGDPSIHSALWPGFELAWPRTLRRNFLARLAASVLRTAALRGNRNRGRISAPALSHEAHSPRAHMGFHPRAYHPGISDSVLGSPAGPAAFGGSVCLSKRI